MPMKQNTSELNRPTNRMVEKLCCIRQVGSASSLTISTCGATGSDSHATQPVHATNNIQIASDLVCILFYRK